MVRQRFLASRQKLAGSLFIPQRKRMTNMQLFGRKKADQRRRFITEQVYQIAPRFSQDGTGVHFDEENCDWLMIPRYPMPERWKQRWTSLLLVFPTTYPVTPPVGFYLRIRLGLKEWSP
jgi:hypothetical protein